MALGTIAIANGLRRPKGGTTGEGGGGINRNILGRGGGRSHNT